MLHGWRDASDRQVRLCTGARLRLFVPFLPFNLDFCMLPRTLVFSAHIEERIMTVRPEHRHSNRNLSGVMVPLFCFCRWSLAESVKHGAYG